MSLVSQRRWQRRTTDWNRSDSALFGRLVSPARGRGRPAADLNLWGQPVRLWLGERADGPADELPCREVAGGWEFDLDASRRLRVQHAAQVGWMAAVAGALQPEFGAVQQTLVLDPKPRDFPDWRTRLALPRGVALTPQGALAPDEIAEGCHRPDSVVGSLALFDGGAKLGHVYRPRAHDAAGRACWLELSVAAVADGVVLGVGLPASEQARQWWRDAVAPVFIDPTFGYTTVGGTSINASEDYVAAYGPFAPASDGAVTSVAMYLTGWSGSQQYTLGVYDDSSGSPDALLRDGGGATASGDGWCTDTLDSGLSVTASTPYWLAENNDSTPLSWYDTASGFHLKRGGLSTYAHGSLADPIGTISLTRTDRKYSIYATYTAAGGATERGIGRGIARGVLRGAH